MERNASWRAAVIAAALVLLWRVIAVNAVSYDVTGRPIAAGSSDTKELSSRLRANPGDARSLVALARSDAQRGAFDLAAARLAAASGIAPIDREVLQAEAAALFAQGRPAEGASQLSRLASVHGDYGRLFPAFAQMLEARDPALLGIAAENPRWLGPFIVERCSKGADASMLALLLQYRSTATSRPEPGEVDCVTERLRAAGRWNEAYHAWLNTLTRERLSNVGFVFNGSFEYPPSGVGFDWKPDRTPQNVSGHMVELVVSREGRGDRALRVAYTGKRQVSPALMQYLAVPPGRYQLSGWARVDHLNSPRGVQWVVRCAADAKQPVLAASERFLGSSEWDRFMFDVNIPAGCAGEALQLEPVDMDKGTTFLSGNLWFDELTLSLRR